MSKKFEEVVTLRTDIGLLAVVTKKEMRNGYQVLAFSFFKEFERKPGTPVQRTTYLNERHIDECHKLLERVREVIQLEKDRGFEKNRRESQP